MQINPGLEEAAQSLGKTQLQSFVRVTLPIMMPSIFASAAMVFLLTMKELPATLILGPTGFDTLATSYMVGVFRSILHPNRCLVLDSRRRRWRPYGLVGFARALSFSLMHPPRSAERIFAVIALSTNETVSTSLENRTRHDPSAHQPFGRDWRHTP